MSWVFYYSQESFQFTKTTLHISSQHHLKRKKEGSINLIKKKQTVFMSFCRWVFKRCHTTLSLQTQTAGYVEAKLQDNENIACSLLKHLNININSLTFGPKSPITRNRLLYSLRVFCVILFLPVWSTPRSRIGCWTHVFSRNITTWRQRRILYACCFSIVLFCIV